MIPLALIALLLPGFAWWVWLGDREQDSIVSLAQVLGISLSVIILIAEAVFFLGMRFSRVGIALILVFFAGIAIYGFIKKGLKIPQINKKHLWIGLSIFALAIAWRLFQARNLLLPNWVDSQHHYLIIRVILEQRGLPETLEPYLSTPFYYHYGFHAVTAFFTALSGLEIAQSMLVLGQILNAAIGLSVYALGKSIFKDWRPALGAALLVSFVSRMPAYYLSWGRYTLAAGMVLLPLAMAIALDLLSGQNRKKHTVLLALLTGAVLLTHYFASILLALCMIFITLVFLVSRWRNLRNAVNQSMGIPVGAGLGLVMASPWLTRLIQYSTASASVGVNLPESLASVIADPGELEYISNLLGPASNHWLLLAGAVGLILGVVRRKSLGIILWSISLGVLSLPWSLTLRPFRPDHFAIVLFLPTALWAGWLFWQTGLGLGTILKQRWLQTLVMILIVVGWIAWAFPLQSDIVNPVTVMVTEDDLEALQWVRENTPPDARFFINTDHWLSGIYRGVDGGGWLLPYTGRWSIVPTVFYNFSPDLEVNQQIRTWGKRASEITTCSSDFWDLVEEADLDWIYIREGVGNMQSEELLGFCGNIRQVYQNSSINIYQIQK